MQLQWHLPSLLLVQLLSVVVSLLVLLHTCWLATKRLPVVMCVSLKLLWPMLVVLMRLRTWLP